MPKRESHNFSATPSWSNTNPSSFMVHKYQIKRGSYKYSATPSLSHKTKNFKTTKCQREKAITFRLRPHYQTKNQKLQKLQNARERKP